MPYQRKRPVGVTLLAIMFLWIGCVGALIFPIVGLTGGASELWRLAFGSVIHSAETIKTISVVLDFILLVFYVAYAIIGFGLWKLKDWARKAVIGLSIFGIAAVAVVGIAIVRPLIYGFIGLGAALVEFGWIAWYLMRPRVRYAFGAWNRYTPAGEWIEPPGLSKRSKVGVGFLVAASVCVLFIVPLFLAIDAEMRASAPYKMGLDAAQTSPCVVKALGLPIKPGSVFSGSIEESSTEGSAQLSYSISGPAGKGNLSVRATKARGNWNIDSLAFTHGAIRSVLVPSGLDHDCQ
jgi:hypothetical protein